MVLEAGTDPLVQIYVFIGNVPETKRQMILERMAHDLRGLEDILGPLKVNAHVPEPSAHVPLFLERPERDPAAGPIVHKWVTWPSGKGGYCVCGLGKHNRRTKTGKLGNSLTSEDWREVTCKRCLGPGRIYRET